MIGGGCVRCVGVWERVCDWCRVSGVSVERVCDWWRVLCEWCGCGEGGM